MLNYRILCKTLALVEKTPSYCTNIPKPNVIKTFNTENKCLYGELIETQKQRRKKITPKDSVAAFSDEETVKLKNKSTQLKSEVKPKTPKSKNSKTNENLKEIDHFPADESTETTKTLKADNSVKTEKAAGLKKNAKNDKLISKPVDSLLIDHEKKIKANRLKDQVVFTSDEFNFQTSVTINEKNYPLNNLNKHELSTDHTDNVICLGFSDPVIKDYLKFPSVSKIMEDTMSVKSKFILSRWRQNMVQDLGEEGFSKHLAGLKTRGQEFHQAVRGAVLGEPVPKVGEIAQNALKSLEWLLHHISNPMAVESLTAHPVLEYKGIPDCVAMFKNIPVLIDWKLSDKPKKDLKDTYEAPVQISAYIGALNHDPNYNRAVSHGLVAVAYASGDPCDVFLLAPKHCEIYWRHWLQRFDKFKSRSHLHLDHNIDEKELGLV